MAETKTPNLDLLIVEPTDFYNYKEQQSDNFKKIDDFAGKTTKNFNTVAEMVASSHLVDGDRIKLWGYHAIDDGGGHERVKSSTDDGTGISLDSGGFANIKREGEYSRKLYGSQLGFVNGSDYTNFLNVKLLPLIQNNSIDEIVLDVDIIMNEKLAFDYDRVLFSGKGKMLSSLEDNMIEVMRNTENKKYYSGLMNKTLLDNQFSANAIKNKHLKVVLLVDSISVGSDRSNYRKMPGVEDSGGINNADVNNRLSTILYNELQSILPNGVKLDFYSRSIGGQTYGELNVPWQDINGNFSGREEITGNEHWRDTVISLEPDLIIHSMGMNHNSSNYLDGLFDNWHTWLYSVGKLNSFDQVILTTPNPNYNTAYQFGDFRDYNLNADKFYIAQQQRAMAKFLNYGIIDVAFNSYLSRYGIDTRSTTAEKEGVATSFIDETTTKTFTTGSEKLKYEDGRTFPYNTLRFNVTTSVDSSAVNFDLKINAGSKIIQFNNGFIKVFNYKISASQYFKSVPFTLPAGTSKIEVSINPSSNSIYVDDKLVYNDEFQFDNKLHDMSLELGSANATSMTFELLETYRHLMPRYSSQIHGREMWGDQWLIKDEFGGGINHPSARGLGNIYLPPLREFLTTLRNDDSKFILNELSTPQANRIFYVGKITNEPYGAFKLLSTMGDEMLKIVNDSNGGISVFEVSTSNSFYIYKNHIYMTILGGGNYKSAEMNGNWVAKIYKQMPINFVLPAGGTTHTKNSYVKHELDFSQVFADGVAEKEVTIPLPAGSIITSISPNVGFNYTTIAVESADDFIYTYTDGGSNLHFRIKFDQTHPSNARERRFTCSVIYKI